MKYNERIHREKKKLSASFYIVVASCLLIIGGASWFAVANYERNATTSSNFQKSESYDNNINSYTENTTSTPITETPTESVAEPLQNVEKPTESKAPTPESAVSSKPQSVTSSKSESKPTTPKFQYTMPVEGDILKFPSETQLQYSKTYNDMRLHKGIDIACKKGTPVNACADGTILSIEESQTLGTTVTIDHGAGVAVKYSAIEKPKFSVGDSVKMGDVIGNASTVPSECKDKSHIHIEILRNGKYVDLSAFGLG